MVFFVPLVLFPKSVHFQQCHIVYIIYNGHCSACVLLQKKSLSDLHLLEWVFILLCIAVDFNQIGVVSRNLCVFNLICVCVCVMCVLSVF